MTGMIIPSSIDESTIEDVCLYADESYAKLKEDRPWFGAAICSLKGRINERLQERNIAAYDMIIGLATSGEYNKAMQYDYELQCFTIAASIYQTEKGNESTIFDCIDYVDDFAKIYRKMSNYYRRIQLGFSESNCQEIMGYIDENNLSICSVSQLLLNSKVGNKEKVALYIAKMYGNVSRYNEAIYLLSTVEDICRPDYKLELSEYKMKYMELA